MTQEIFDQLVDEAKILTKQLLNDFENTLNELIEEFEEEDRS